MSNANRPGEQTDQLAHIVLVRADPRLGKATSTCRSAAHLRPRFRECNVCNQVRVLKQPRAQRGYQDSQGQARHQWPTQRQEEQSAERMPIS